jgi:hypothetical protein
MTLILLLYVLVVGCRSKWTPEIRTYCALLNHVKSEALEREWLALRVAANGGYIRRDSTFTDEERTKSQQDAGWHDWKADVNRDGIPYRSSPPIILVGMKIDLRQRIFLYRERQQLKQANAVASAAVAAAEADSTLVVEDLEAPSSGPIHDDNKRAPIVTEEKDHDEALKSHTTELCAFEDGLNMARV